MDTLRSHNRPCPARPVLMARFSRDDWLVLGLAQLSAHGPNGLRIEPLCAAAARTRGSFYHHFDDHDAFIAALLEHWREWNTDGVIEMVELEAEISGKRARLSALAAGLDQQMEVAIRQFAAVNPQAKLAVTEVDETRISYLARKNEEERGEAEDRARILAQIEYAAFIGFQHLFPDADEARLIEIGETLEQMIANA